MTKEKSISKLTEMVKRGRNYREEYEFEYGGETVVGVIRPLVDDEFLPIAAFLAEQLDLDEEIEEEEAVGEAIDRIEKEQEDEEEGAPVDVSNFDEEFVRIMQGAAALGLVGQKTPDGEIEEFDDEEVEGIIGDMVGGYSLEIGGEVLSLSGDVRDAEKFRGGRGSV